MHIVVCVKEVIDPLIPPASLQVADGGDDIEVTDRSSPVPNGFDLQALEAALRLRDEHDDVSVTALTSGAGLDGDALKRAVGPFVDDFVLVDDPTRPPWDSTGSAMTLAAAIRHLGGADLILCGRQSSDWSTSLVPVLLATELDSAYLALAHSVRLKDGELRVESLADDGINSFAAHLPAVVTVTSELGELRYPSVKQRLAAAKLRPTRLNAAELGVSESPIPTPIVTGVAIPVITSQVEFIEASDSKAAGRELARLLIDRKILTVTPRGGTS